MGTDYNSRAADDEAERLARMDADDEALELRQANIERETRAALLATLADSTGDIIDLIKAIDDAMAQGTLSALALIGALRNDHRALITWARDAIDQAANRAAEAYTMQKLHADRAAYEQAYFEGPML